LRAELVDHYEVGISHAFSKKVKGDLTYFHNAGTDRIVVSPPPPFPPVFKNVGEFTTKGVEGTLTLSPLTELSLFAGFTYLKAQPNDLPYAPEWTASLGVNYRFLEKFMISMDGLYVDEQYVTSRGRTTTAVNTEKVGAYFLLNARLTYDFRIPSFHLDCTAFVAGENLTDTDYEQKKSYPMPGISGMAGLILRF
jgi:outer membrane receptor protein involved in Fe transport